MLAMSVTFGVSFGKIGRDDLAGPVDATAERNPALLDVGARYVELNSGYAVGIRKNSRNLGVLADAGAADIDDNNGLLGPQCW